MFRGESGGLSNVPTEATLRKAVRACRTSRQDGSSGRRAGKQLLDRISETVRGLIAGAGLSPLENAGRKYILREFAATGRPPTLVGLKDEMKLSSVSAARRIVARLNEADIVTKEGDRIISSYPFSAEETRHRVVFQDGHEVYALCATDALGIHFMLESPLAVHSRCPECENEMTIRMKGGVIVSSDPGGIVQFVSDSGECGCTAKTFCPYMNFFCSRAHAAAWRKRNPDLGKGELYSLRETLKYGKEIFASFLK